MVGISARSKAAVWLPNLCIRIRSASKVKTVTQSSKRLTGISWSVFGGINESTEKVTGIGWKHIRKLIKSGIAKR